jgi:hypothetical protein
MSKILKSFKYIITESVKPIAIYYVVIALVIIFWAVMPVLFPESNVNFGGLKASTVIFLFVVGLNAFKSSYLFLQANGITRRHYYAAGALSLVTISVAMTIFDSIVDGTLGLFITMEHGLWKLLYPGSGLVDSFLWALAINLLAVFIGWFITMVFYRSSKTIKLVISLSPAILSVLLPIVNRLFGGGIMDALKRFFLMALGLSGTPNASVGALSMVMMAVAAAGLAFLLVRRAPIKEQER